VTTRSPRRRPRKRRSRRKGLALLAVVLTLLGISVLLTTMYAVVLPQHRGERTRWAALRADLSVVRALADSSLTAPWPWIEGDDNEVDTQNPEPGLRTQGQRVALQLPFVAWQLQSQATGQGAPDGGGAFALVLGRRTLNDPLPAAAMLAIAPVQLDSGVIVSGAPVAPPAWTTCATESRSAALRLTDPTHFSGAQAIVVGAPPIGSALHASAQDSIGRSIAALERGVTMAFASDTLVGEPTALGGRCVRSVNSLGEPRRIGGSEPCRGYAPVVRVRSSWGTVVVPRAARMQGALIVDGSLELRAPLEVTGVLVVRGALDASRAPLTVSGTLITHGPAHLGPGSRVAYAQCAALGGQLSAAPIRPMTRGGVMQP
jgi:hypothetical protein